MCIELSSHRNVLNLDREKTLKFALIRGRLNFSFPTHTFPFYDLGKKDSTLNLNVVALTYPILKKYGRFGITIEFSVI
jgi:hypothetical protein